MIYRQEIRSKNDKRRTAECTSCGLVKHSDDFSVVELGSHERINGYGICKNCDDELSERRKKCIVCGYEKHIGDFREGDILSTSGKCKSCRERKSMRGNNIGGRITGFLIVGSKKYRCKECDIVKDRNEFVENRNIKDSDSCITGRCKECAEKSREEAKKVIEMEEEYWKTHKKSEGNAKLVDDAVDVISLRIMRKHADAKRQFTDSGKVRLSSRKYWTVAAEEKSKTMARFIAEEEIDEIHERMILLGMTPNDLLTPVSEDHIGVEF